MKILFQGDSITDTCRTDSENPDISLGDGYPKLVAEQLPVIYPYIDFEFINRGVSGSRSIDLVNRWEEETLTIKPDVLTILIGVNDCWHHAEGTFPYVTNEEFEKNFRYLLSSTKEKTPAKIIVIEPYVYENRYLDFRNDVLDKIEVERKVSLELADYYIPLDGLFYDARVLEKDCEWTKDGVHPSDAGHELIARYVTDAICNIIDVQNEAEE